MAIVDPLFNLINIKSSKLSRQELFLLEAEFFIRICEELRELFRKEHKEYFRLMKFNVEKENAMLESNFTRLILRDILSTEDYTIKGIAQYTDTHEDVIQEVIDGRNTSPSATFLRKIIELHRSVRRELYQAIMKKITCNT